MRFSCYKNDLADALKLVSRCAAVKPTLPIFAGVKLSAETQKLTLESTDLNLSANVVIPVHTEDNGAVVVNAKYLNEIINRLSDEVVTFSDDGNYLNVQSGGANFSLLTFNAEDFPAVDFPTENVGEMLDEFFKLIIRQVSFAADPKSIDRPLFQAVNFKTVDNNLTVLATNSHRIAKLEICCRNMRDFNVNIPATSLKAIEPFISGDGNSKVQFFSDGKFFALKFGNATFKTRLVEGVFPPTERLFNAERPIAAEFYTAELKAALSRAQVIAKDTDYNTVRLELAPKSITVTANSDELGNTREVIEANCTGELSISFNISYLTDFLGVVQSSRMRVFFDGEYDPALCKETGNESLSYIVTPVRT